MTNKVERSGEKEVRRRKGRERKRRKRRKKRREVSHSRQNSSPTASFAKITNLSPSTPYSSSQETSHSLDALHEALARETLQTEKRIDTSRSLSFLRFFVPMYKTLTRFLQSLFFSSFAIVITTCSSQIAISIDSLSRKVQK